MRERRAYIVLVAISVILSLAVWVSGRVNQERNNHKFCQIITTSLQGATMSHPPANPKQHPAGEKLYKNYIIVRNLGKSLGCLLYIRIGMSLSNKQYDFLKTVALVWLPAIGTLYFALSGFWNLPDATGVVGSITAVDTFLGGILHVSSTSYTPPAATATDAGEMVVDPKAGTVQLNLATDPEKLTMLEKGQIVSFKVTEKPSA